MNIEAMLQAVRDGSLSIDEAKQQINTLAFEDIGYARIDHHREMRVGVPEVVYCAGKTADQVEGIARRLDETASGNVLLTRLSPDRFEQISDIANIEYHPDARIAVIWHNRQQPKGNIAICAAGTSDIYVAEEAALTATALGNGVNRYYDVGVAGIHRLFASMDEIRQANVIVSVAGMEGALPGVLAGLVDRPVIAVPTSVGYGANFAGLSALLTMINSCAAGISVVNIDNGFGAGYIAGMINSLACGGENT